MLRIEEIVGAMDDEFRYALAALDDERLMALAADKAALRRLRPVGVSHAEALAMIADIQAKREATRSRDAEAARRKAERAAKRKAAPRRRAPRGRDTPGNQPPPMVAALPAPAPLARLNPPQSNSPAIRLPPPAADTAAIPMPPPATASPAAMHLISRRRHAVVVAAVLTALAVIALAAI